MIGTPSKKGHIYDMSLFNSFKSSGIVTVFSVLQNFNSTNLAEIIGFAKNPRMYDDQIICDISVLHNEIFYYDMLIDKNAFTKMVIIGCPQENGYVPDAIIDSMYIGEEYGWNL